MEREQLFCADGSPKYVCCYEDKDSKSIARFTIVFTEAAHIGGEGYTAEVHYVVASENPRYALGYYQHSSRLAWQFQPDGELVPFSSLPKNLRDAVLEDYKDLWRVE
jgi:hypothetical protein